MRAPSEVKPYLEHADPYVRRFAVQYFEQMLCHDDDVMPRVFRGVFQAPPAEQRLLLAASREFTQTPASMEQLGYLIIHEPYLRDLAETLFVGAPAELLQNFTQYFPQLSYFGQRAATRRMALLRMNSQRLLEKMMEYSARPAGWALDPFEYVFGAYMLRELVARPDAPLGLLRQWALAERPDDYQGYDDVYATVAARLCGFSDLTDHLLDNLYRDDDDLNDETLKTLIVLASPQLVDAICERYWDGPWEFRMWSSGILAGYKDESSERALLKLLDVEDDDNLRMDLAKGLCDVLSIRAIPAIKAVLVEQEDEPESVELMGSLYAHCIISEVAEPALGEWKIRMDESEAGFRRYLDELDQ